MIDKLRALQAMLGDRPIEIEVDGGINAETAPRAIRAGANVLVAGSSIFGSADYAEAIRGLRS
jgi:ribulose-phosphate 3-epimerase